MTEPNLTQPANSSDQPGSNSAGVPSGGGPGPAVPIDDFVVHSQRVPVKPPQRRASAGGSAVLVLAGIVAVGGLAFAAGRLTAPTAAAASNTNQTAGGPVASAGTGRGGFGGGFGNGTGGAGNGFGSGITGLAGSTALTISGTVASVGNGTLTLTLPSGATVEIVTDTATTYHTQAPATASGVKVGSKILVETAGGARGFGGGAGPGASPSPLASGQSALNAARTAQDITIVP